MVVWNCTWTVICVNTLFYMLPGLSWNILLHRHWMEKKTKHFNNLVAQISTGTIMSKETMLRQGRKTSRDSKRYLNSTQCWVCRNNLLNKAFYTKECHFPLKQQGSPLIFWMYFGVCLFVSFGICIDIEGNPINVTEDITYLTVSPTVNTDLGDFYNVLGKHSKPLPSTLSV